MPQAPLTIYFAIMAASLLCVTTSAVAISLKEKSWVNWYTLYAAEVMATLYLLPAIYILVNGPAGSYFAYAYCYTTYACTSACAALSYCYLKPLGLRRTRQTSPCGFELTPWALLLGGFLAYLPVLRAFSGSLLQPREIYQNFSTAGLGLSFFSSAILVTLAYVTFLFKPKKSVPGAFFFLVVSGGLIYLHGSKGQLVVLAYLGVLYRVYVSRKKASMVAAATMVGLTGVFAILLFAAFGNASDAVELAVDMAGYSDYGRNAMTVIDDANAHRYWGQLELEDELYSRVPRLLMPDKPRAFGQVRLARRYYPQAYREAAGTPNFGIGMQYADFGPAAILILCLCAALTGWLARSLVVSMSYAPSSGSFLMLLFFSGINIIPLGAGYMLPEILLLAILLDWFQKTRFSPLPLSPQRSIPSQNASV